MMTVKEQITLNIENTLANIRQLGGYSQDAIAERAKARGTNIEPFKLIIAEDAPDTLLDDRPQHKDDYNAQYTIKCFVALDDDPDATPPPDVLVTRIAADVKMALAQDYTRGGWAINTTFQPDAPLPSNERDGYCGRSVSVTVLYRTALNNPYSQ